jgi:hypothetical protein
VYRKILLSIVLVFSFGAFLQPGDITSANAEIPAVSVVKTIAPTAAPKPVSPTPTIDPSKTPAASSSQTGPDHFASNINPLTGLPVEDPSLLAYQPALVSVSNFPASARPQTGLSLAPHVYEITIGEGETRFLAVFYGNYGSSNVPPESTGIGPIRSGRLVYEDLKTLYQGFIVMAGASPEVGAQLSGVKQAYSNHPGNINGDAISIADLETTAEKRADGKGSPTLNGTVFDSAVPAGGSDATKLNIFWSLRDQVEWVYNPATGKYLRSQDKADGKGTFVPATDKLTGEQLSADNVVILAADHDYQTPTRIDIDIAYIKKGNAYFLRDGKIFRVYWTSLAPLGPIRFMDEAGNPFAVKPGNTWFEVIYTLNTTKETEPGVWFTKFYNPN